MKRYKITVSCTKVYNKKMEKTISVISKNILYLLTKYDNIAMKAYITYSSVALYLKLQ